MGLLKLPIELLLYVIEDLDRTEMMELRLVCKFLNRIILLNAHKYFDFNTVDDDLVVQSLLEVIVENPNCGKDVVSGVRQIVKSASRLKGDSGSASTLDREQYQIACSVITDYKGKEWVQEQLDDSTIHDSLGLKNTEDEAVDLVVAACYGLYPVVKQLLEGGVNVNSCHKYLGSALYAAAYLENNAVVELLLEHQPDFLDQDGYIGSPFQTLHSFFHFCEDYPEDELRRLEYGIALQEAAFNGHTSVVATLISQESTDPDYRIRRYEETPLFLATRNGGSDVVQLLLRVPTIKPDFRFNKGPSPLWSAAILGYSSIVQLFLQHREVDPNHCSPGSALFAAALVGHEEIVRMLLDDGNIKVYKGTRRNSLDLLAQELLFYVPTFTTRAASVWSNKLI
ncbi:MAG: hypothetical protein M1825_003970 [Sarcosagium campestre]|nr:MAG: hypothetical protein M1825_003970 [Sarcosagium campestre]